MKLVEFRVWNPVLGMNVMNIWDYKPNHNSKNSRTVWWWFCVCVCVYMNIYIVSLLLQMRILYTEICYVFGCDAAYGMWYSKCSMGCINIDVNKYITHRRVWNIPQIRVYINGQYFWNSKPHGHTHTHTHIHRPTNKGPIFSIYDPKLL